MNNRLIYTCITGGYDTPTDDFMKKPGYDYILISDQHIETNSWKCIVLSFDGMDNLNSTKKQRYVKTHPHELFKEYDVIVWIDANTSINNALYDYIEKNITYPITFKVHPFRHCIYDEICAVNELKKEDTKICEELYWRYKEEGVPENIGMYETNVIVSHPDDNIVQMIFNEWWKEIEHNSKRDQLSLTYVLWKNRLMRYPHSAVSYQFSPKPHSGLILK